MKLPSRSDVNVQQDIRLLKTLLAPTADTIRDAGDLIVPGQFN